MSATMAVISFFVYIRTGSFITPLFIMASGGKYREVMVPVSSNSAGRPGNLQCNRTDQSAPGKPHQHRSAFAGKRFREDLEIMR